MQGLLKLYSWKYLFNKHKIFNSLWNFKYDKQSNTRFILFSHSKFLGCDRLPPLKEISSPRFEEARNKIGLAYVEVGYHPLKKSFVDSPWVLGLG